MRALSIQQPWADLILFGGKDIENRTWPLPDKMRGQRIYVHAGKKPDGLVRGIGPERFGAILGEVTILGYIDDVTETPNLSEWFEGPYGFVLGRSQGVRKAHPMSRAIRIF